MELCVGYLYLAQRIAAINRLIQKRPFAYQAKGRFVFLSRRRQKISPPPLHIYQVRPHKKRELAQ